MEGNIKTAHFPVVVNGRTLAIFSFSHNTKNRVSRLAQGKRSTVKTGKRLNAPDLWPMTLIVDIEDVTVKASAACHDGEEIILFINGDEFN